MNAKRKLLNILLVVLVLILGYNYVAAPILTQNSIRMGMGMHWRMYGQTNYYIGLHWIVLVIIAIAGLILYEGLRAKSAHSKCVKCGKTIENDRWKICPVCGNRL